MGWRLAVWAASCKIPRTRGEPCLVMWPWRTLRSQVVHLGSEPGPGAQLAGGREPADVADLGDQRHCRELADPGQDLKRLDPRVGLGQAGDLPFQPGDRGGQGVQQPTAVLDDPPWGRWQVQAGQPGPPRTSPQAPVLGDTAVGQHRMHPVLAGGAHADQGGPVPQQGPQITDLLGRDPGSASRSARSSWARVAASTLSFLSRAEAIALQRLGWTSCGSKSSSSSSSTSHP
jgi:hypothetical protein